MKDSMWQQFFYMACIMLLLLAACKKEIQPTPVATTQDHNHYSFLALGDSYTIGQAVKEEERFPAQTQLMLQAVGKQVDRLAYIAATGWTTTDLQNAIDQQNPQGPFDIVTLLIGVNDQNKQRDTIGYCDRFTTLLEKAISLTGNRSNRVFVLSIPDYSATPYGAIDDTVFIRKQIDLFNNINLRASKTYGVSYTDITGVSREALIDATLIAKDNLHPSGKMYRKWAELLMPNIKERLK